MKLRKFELKKLPVLFDSYGDPIKGEPAIFDYRRTTIDIIRAPGQGADAETIAKSVYFCGKIIEAVKDAKDFVLLTQDDYDFLKNKVLRFTNWVAATDFVNDYIQYVKNLPLEDYDVTPKVVTPDAE
jgi:hypothetical protein